MYNKDINKKGDLIMEKTYTVSWWYNDKLIQKSNLTEKQAIAIMNSVDDLNPTVEEEK